MIKVEVHTKVYPFPCAHFTQRNMPMDARTRIQKDILMFKENLQSFEGKKLDGRKKKIIELASQYYSDAQYYLEKEDHLTAFGCINYAHGLLDAIIKF